MFGDLTVRRGVVIPANELIWRFTPTGGPGGQHANRSSTRVELSFSIATSVALSDAVRQRLLEKIGPVMTVSCDQHRSQYRNRVEASERLAATVREALLPERTRTATKPSRGSVQRRLATKNARSQTKNLRRRPTSNE